METKACEYRRLKREQQSWSQEAGCLEFQRDPMHEDRIPRNNKNFAFSGIVQLLRSEIKLRLAYEHASSYVRCNSQWRDAVNVNTTHAAIAVRRRAAASPVCAPRAKKPTIGAGAAAASMADVRR